MRFKLGSVWIADDGSVIVLVRRVDDEDESFDYAQLNGTHNGTISIECLDKRFTRLMGGDILTIKPVVKLNKSLPSNHSLL